MEKSVDETDNTFLIYFYEIYKPIYLLYPTFNLQETPSHRISKIRYRYVLAYRYELKTKNNRGKMSNLT